MSLSFPTFASSPLMNSTVPIGKVDTSDSRKGITHAATEFESILLNQWFEGAEASFGSVPGGADDDGDAGEAQMKSFSVQALSKAITAAGGIGLASIVSRALADQQAVAPASIDSPRHLLGT